MMRRSSRSDENTRLGMIFPKDELMRSARRRHCNGPRRQQEEFSVQSNIMPMNVQIPALGESVTEAVLLKWHKQDGESVAQDEPICELETDKANVDLPSPAA